MIPSVRPDLLPGLRDWPSDHCRYNVEKLGVFNWKWCCNWWFRSFPPQCMCLLPRDWCWRSSTVISFASDTSFWRVSQCCLSLCMHSAARCSMYCARPGRNGLLACQQMVHPIWLDAIWDLQQDDAGNDCAFNRVWCLAHQLDLIIKASLRPSADATAFQFMTTLTTAIGWLRWQDTLIQRMGSKCPYYINVRWTSVSKVRIPDLLYHITHWDSNPYLLFPLLLVLLGIEMDAQKQNCYLSLFWREMIRQQTTSRVVDGWYHCQWLFC